MRFNRHLLICIAVLVVGHSTALSLTAPVKAALLQNDLISYWRLNEGAGVTAFDTATGGVADNGTLRANPAWINGIFNSGLQFTGTQDVLIPNSSDMDIGTNALTLSAWVKLDKLPGDATLPSFAGVFDSAPDNYVLYIDKANAELRFKVVDNAMPNGVTTGAHPGIPASMLNTTSWQHVMGVYDGSQGSVKIYLNGSLVDIGSMPTVVQTVRAGQVASIGGQPTATSPFTPSNFFQGAIADVAVWKRPLGAAEAQYLYNSGTGNAVGAANPDIAPLPALSPSAPAGQPVIYYSLNGDIKNYGTGGAALDAVAVGPNAASPLFAPSQNGQGLNLKGNPNATASTVGTGDYLSVNYVLPDDGTISMNFSEMTWFNFSTLWSNSVHADAWESWIYDVGRLAARSNEGSGNANLDYFLPLSGNAATPHHVAFTWDRNGTTMLSKLYVDGVLREQFTETWRAPGSTLFFGGGLGPGSTSNTYGKGIFDEIRVYDTTLSASEVLFLSQVPEPASFAMMCLAVCGLFMRRATLRA